MDKSILWGRGTTKNIVAVETLPNQQNIAQVYRRVEGKVVHEAHPYLPFLFVDSEDPNLKKFDNYESIKLFGSNPLNLLVQDTNYGLIRAMSNHTRSYHPLLQSQWMLRTGETLFTGMEFDDPLRLYIDIEVYTSPGYDFPNSDRPNDKVTMVSLLTNRGQGKVMVLNDDGNSPQMDNVTLYDSEKELLEALVVGIRKLDPDILLTHNGFSFDLPYLRDRMQMHDVKFGIGRNGSEPRTFTTSIKFAEKSDEYTNFHVYGRHVIDTYFLAKQFDSIARVLPSYSLKECAKFLGTVDDRTYIEGNEIASVWDGSHDTHTREDLIRYALDDVKETRILDKAWGNAKFQMTKAIPLPFQDVSRYGTGTLIDLLFTRYYLENLWSWPVPDPERKFGGGYAQTFVYGHIDEPLVYADFGSLYPTLAQVLNIQPKKDELKLFQDLITLLKAERYVYKNLSKDGETETIRNDAKAVDGSVKVLLNTASYGWIGWSFGAFNDYDEAERITIWGQKSIKRMNYEAEKLNGRVIRSDTDGSLIVVPEQFRGEDKELEFIGLLEDKVNEWLRGELNG